MCDTMVATGPATADGTVILAKNSDREPNEAHVLTHIPRAQHEAGSVVRCTYIEVPQVPETHEVLLSRPFWLWGCEIGANECGVAIGNEAMFTREPYEKGPGLVGMDLMRLALERADTARRGLEVIVDLLAAYGQGGNCGLHHKLYYHTSFILADPTEAWVLETAGKFWAAEQVHGVRSISNGLTIGSEWDLASPGLVEHAIERGWCRSNQEFHFARCYSDRLYTRLDGCRTRQQRSTALLSAQEGQITAERMMDILRDHGPQAEADPNWNPGRGWLMDTLCAHASLGPTRTSQSTGSMVAHLAADLPTIWLTGTSGTCSSVFKPVYVGAGLPGMGPEPADTYDPNSLWWVHERLQRAILRDYATRMPAVRTRRDALQNTFLHEAAETYARCHAMLPAERAAPLAAFSAACFERTAQAETGWANEVTFSPVVHRPPFPFALAWRRFNKQGHFPSV